MFLCSLGWTYADGPLFVQIEGCPEHGIAAIDFRRAHGLSDAPTSAIELPGFAWIDEPFVRQHAHRANEEADLRISDRMVGTQTHWRLGTSGEIWKDRPRWIRKTRDSGPLSLLAPKIIRDYLAQQTPETGRALLLDLWHCEFRSLVRAILQVHNLTTEAGRAAALKLLDDDNDKLAEACALADAWSEGVSI